MVGPVVGGRPGGCRVLGGEGNICLGYSEHSDFSPVNFLEVAE